MKATLDHMSTKEHGCVPGQFIYKNRCWATVCVTSAFEDTEMSETQYPFPQRGWDKLRPEVRTPTPLGLVNYVLPCPPGSIKSTFKMKGETGAIKTKLFVNGIEDIFII